MRVLGARTTAATLGLGLVATTLGLLGAGTGGPGSVRYEVTASLRSVGGGPVYACTVGTSWNLTPVEEF